MTALLPLTNDEKSRLQRLNQQKEVVFALKKLFLNAASDRPASYDVNFLAAHRVAIDIICDVFHDLEVMQPDNQMEIKAGNLV